MIRKLNLLLSFIFVSFFHQEIYSQNIEQLSLDECIKIALDNNISLKRAINNEQIAKSNRMAALMAFLPDLAATINSDFTKGTFFDQSAFRQVSTTTNTSSPLIRSSVTIFNGFANHYNFRARSSEESAAEYGITATTNTVKENVLVSYLNVILGKENLVIANNRISLLQSQLEREIKRESVGVGNMESVYNFRSQIANEKLNQVRFNNQLKTDQLLLIQTLQLDISNEYEIESEFTANDDALLELESYDNILDQGISYSPLLKQARANQEASLYGFKIAKARRMPTIGGFGQYGSRYSSNGARSPDSGEILENAAFFDQLNWNAYSYFNLSLNIPIFSRFQNTNAIQVAKLNLSNTELAVKESMMNTTNSIQRVYLELVAAQSTYRAAVENAEALEQSFNFVKRRYETGNTDFFTYLEALNNKNRGEIELINSKYSIVFRKKILDVYKGM
jgi:outer membrane protein